MQEATYRFYAYYRRTFQHDCLWKYTFFEENTDAFAGKTLIPFSTHEGSGPPGFDRKLESACPNSQVLEGLAIRVNDCQNKQDSVRSTVNDWLVGLGY